MHVIGLRHPKGCSPHDPQVDEFITHNMKLDEINDAFEVMHKGEAIRPVLHM